MPNTEKSKCVFIFVNYFISIWVIWLDILTIITRKVLITNPEVENSRVITIKQQKIWIRVMGNLISTWEYLHQNSNDTLKQLFTLYERQVLIRLVVAQVGFTVTVRTNYNRFYDVRSNYDFGLKTDRKLFFFANDKNDLSRF